MSSLQDVEKFDEFQMGQLKALVTKCGGIETVKDILREEVIISFLDCYGDLFNDHGHRIKPRTNFTGHREWVDDPYFKTHFFTQPKIDYEFRMNQLIGFFFGPGSRNVLGFKKQSERLLKQIKKSKHLKGLLKGIHLPIILPELNNKKLGHEALSRGSFDYGRVLEDVFLHAVKKSLKNQFKSRKIDLNENILSGKTHVIAGSRHDRLVDYMKSESLIAIFFPEALRGYSFEGCIEQMETLPNGLWLAGGFDTATAMIMYPDVLARDNNVPALTMPAISCASHEGLSLNFNFINEDYCFNDTGRGGMPSGYDSHGLLYIGQ